MFAKTQKSVSMILGVALVAAASFAAPAFAGEAALSHNERASQEAILGTAATLPVSVDASSATLAHNEDLAKRVIVDVPTHDAPVDAIGQATLTHNEIAAQRVIVDAPASDSSSRHAANAATRVASARSPTDR